MGSKCHFGDLTAFLGPPCRHAVSLRWAWSLWGPTTATSGETSNLQPGPTSQQLFSVLAVFLWILRVFVFGSGGYWDWWGSLFLSGWW